MFVNENYINYKYLVEVNDNYVVLTNKSSISASYDNQKSYDVIYQYLKPSTLTIEQTRTARNDLVFERIDVSTDFWDRADCPEILTASILTMWIFIFILNGLTRIAKKGGIFFGN